MAYTPITRKNVTEYPVGTRVRFQYGPSGGEDALVVDFEIDRWGERLVAETSNGDIKKIEGFSDVGIGCHLIEHL